VSGGGGRREEDGGAARGRWELGNGGEGIGAGAAEPGSSVGVGCFFRFAIRAPLRIIRLRKSRALRRLTPAAAIVGGLFRMGCHVLVTCRCVQKYAYVYRASSAACIIKFNNTFKTKINYTLQHSPLHSSTK
jgi:hypothetical protein